LCVTRIQSICECTCLDSGLHGVGGVHHFLRDLNVTVLTNADQTCLKHRATTTMRHRTRTSGTTPAVCVQRHVQSQDNQPMSSQCLLRGENQPYWGTRKDLRAIRHTRSTCSGGVARCGTRHKMLPSGRIRTCMERRFGSPCEPATKLKSSTENPNVLVAVRSDTGHAIDTEIKLRNRVSQLLNPRQDEATVASIDVQRQT